MKKRSVLYAVCIVIIIVGVLSSSIVTAQTATPMTALEKKLYQAALKEGEFNWWGPLSLKEASLMIKAFNSKYPGIKISNFEGTADMTSEKYLAEYKAGKATADTIDPEPMTPFKEQKLLLNVIDIVKDVNYPLQFCLKDFTGVTQDHTVAVTGYNTKLVAPQDVPRSWEDLLNSKWKGKIALEQRMKTFIYVTEHYGESWIVNYLKKLKEQKPIFSKGATASITLLSAGEFPLCVGVYLHTIRVGAEKGQPIALVPITPAGHNAISPICIPKSAPHPNAAKLFVRWWISPEGQLVSDKVRFKGNPMPGSGTSQSIMLEKQKVKVFSTTEWTSDNEERLVNLYQEAVGFAKK
jgi:iron(III) transport system substrate-binding protein